MKVVKIILFSLVIVSFTSVSAHHTDGEEDEMNSDVNGWGLAIGVVIFVIVLYFIFTNEYFLEDIRADVKRKEEKKELKKAKKDLSVALLLHSGTTRGTCDQDTGGLFSSSECGNSTNNRCPRCGRYACGSCLGSRTYNGRKVCEACNRNMSGD